MYVCMYVSVAGVARFEDRTLINRLVSGDSSLRLLHTYINAFAAGRDAVSGGAGRERGAVSSEQAGAPALPHAGVGPVLRQAAQLPAVLQRQRRAAALAARRGEAAAQRYCLHAPCVYVQICMYARLRMYICLRKNIPLPPSILPSGMAHPTFKELEKYLLKFN